MRLLHRLRLIERFIVAICLGLLLPSAQPASADTVEDYLVQQVCLSNNGTVTSEDPYKVGQNNNCTSVRKLQIDEKLPYHKWDYYANSSSGQIGDSFPVKDLYGRLRVVHNMFFDNRNDYQVPYFGTGRPKPTWGGTYDIFVNDGNYVSAAGTYDPGRGWQPFWSSTWCSLSDSWIVAPKATTVPFTEGYATPYLTNNKPQCADVSGLVPGFTVWNYYSGMQYESGKALNTIKSWHFNGSGVDAVAFEVFYFTKEYGKTRWEAWSAASTNPNPTEMANAAAHCPTGTAGGYVHFGNTDYRMTDCHDWSNVEAVPSSQPGGWDPTANWHVDPLYTSFNLLQNTHMRCTNYQGNTKDCIVDGGYCQTITPWQRLGNLDWGMDNELQKDQFGVSPRTANCAMKISFPSAPAGQSLYQDVSPNNSYNNYSFGTALWLPYGSPTDTAVAHIYVHQLNQYGQIVAQSGMAVTVSQVAKFFQGTFVRNPAATRFRFEIYPQNQNTVYELTDSWIAPAP